MTIKAASCQSGSDTYLGGPDHRGDRIAVISEPFRRGQEHHKLQLDAPLSEATAR